MKKRICTIIFTLLFILTIGVVASACETDDGTHTIRFDINCGNDFVATYKVKHGETFESPYDYVYLNNMVRVGYYFAGWYKPNGERWSELEPINESMTLTAKWRPKYYKITYELSGGESEGDNPKYFTTEDEVVFNPAIRKGYKFEGWTSRQFSNTGYLEKIEKGTNVDIVVTANWSGDGNDYILSSDGSHVIYNGYTGTADTITVLEQYEGKTVTEISDKAFANLNVKQVSIPSTITKLGVETFKGCTYLKEVILPSSITEIPDGTFENCTSLKSITIPSTVKVIGSNAFRGCPSLEEIILPQGVMELGDSAFENCNNVQSMTFPSSITLIGANVLKGCSSISNLTINCSMTEIPEGFVQNCVSLAEFNIPSTVTKIGANAFNGCEQFTTINVPNTVNNIGDGAFEGCKLLEQVTLSQSVTKLPDRIFYGCTALKNFVLHDAITEIGDYAFYGLASVKNLSIPASVVKIGKYAFAKCTSLTEISVPKTVTQMGGAVFSDCSAVTVITLPFFGSSASDTTGSLQKVFTNFPSNLKSVAVLGGVVSTGAFKKATMVESITIADGVTVSGSENFYDCNALKSLVLPSNVQKIGRSAFYNCVSLTQITIPSSVTSIDVEAFKNCTSLTSIVIGKNVTYVGADAFKGCTLTIKCEQDAIPTTWDGNWNRGKLEVVLGYKE